MTSEIDCFHRYLNSASRNPRYPLNRGLIVYDSDSGSLSILLHVLQPGCILAHIRLQPLHQLHQLQPISIVFGNALVIGHRWSDEMLGIMLGFRHYISFKALLV